MAALVTNVVGSAGSPADIESGATMVGGIGAIDHDTITLANGAHCMLAAARALILGDGATPTTQAIRTSGSAGTGAFYNRGALTLNAHVLQGNQNWKLEAGCSVEFSHASTNLTWQIADANSQSKRLEVAGTSGSPVAVSSNAGGVNGSFTSGGFLNGGIVYGTHGDFTRIGAAAIDAMNLRGDFGTAPAITFADCRFTSCGRLNFPASVQTNHTITFDRCEWRTPLNSTDVCVLFGAPNNAVGTGARRFADCYINGVISFAPRFTFTDCVAEQPTATARTLFTSLTQPTQFERIVVRQAGGGLPVTFNSAPMPSEIKDILIVASNSTNNRALQVDVGALTADLSINGVIIHSEDTSATDDNGDSIVLQSVNAIASTRVVTVQNCIQAPKSNGLHIGKLISPLPSGGNGLTNLDIDAYHNTFVTADSVETALQAGETQGSNNFGTLYRNVKSNLAIGRTAAAGFLFSRYSHTLEQQDLADPAQVQSNWVQNPNGTTVYRIAAGSAFFSTAPAGPLYTGDAQCVNVLRTHATWDASLGGAGTYAAALSRLANKTTRSGAGANDTVAHLLAYWRHGFKPQNPAVRAAHDSNNDSWIGATAGLMPARVPVSTSFLGLRPLTLSRMARA